MNNRRRKKATKATKVTEVYVLVDWGFYVDSDDRQETLILGVFSSEAKAKQAWAALSPLALWDIEVCRMDVIDRKTAYTGP